MNQPRCRGRVAVAGMPATEGLVVRHFESDRDYPGLAELIAQVNTHDGVDWIRPLRPCATRTHIRMALIPSATRSSLT